MTDGEHGGDGEEGGDDCDGEHGGDGRDDGADVGGSGDRQRKCRWYGDNVL